MNKGNFRLAIVVVLALMLEMLTAFALSHLGQVRH